MAGPPSFSIWVIHLQSLVIGITTGYTWLTYCKCITGSVLWRWQYFSISATSTNPAIMEVHIEWSIYIITVNSAVNNNFGWHWWDHLAITPCHRKTLTLSCPAVWSFLDVAVIIAPGCRAWTAKKIIWSKASFPTSTSNRKAVICIIYLQENLSPFGIIRT